MAKRAMRLRSRSIRLGGRPGLQGLLGQQKHTGRGKRAAETGEGGAGMETTI